MDSAMEEIESEDDEGAVKVFGVHRIELATGTKSGYVGVRRCASMKNP